MLPRGTYIGLSLVCGRFYVQGKHYQIRSKLMIIKVLPK